MQSWSVPYNHASQTSIFRKVLQQIGVDRNRASILLTACAGPARTLQKKEGISLQVSDTRSRTVLSLTWMARPDLSPIVYGLSPEIGRMLIIPAAALNLGTAAAAGIQPGDCLLSV